MVRKGSTVLIEGIKGKLLTSFGTGELPDELFRLLGKTKSKAFENFALFKPEPHSIIWYKVKTYTYHKEKCVIIKLTEDMRLKNEIEYGG